jgi:hypothetical protein
MRKSILAAAAAIALSALAGCATTGDAPSLQAQLAAFCGIAKPEIAAFQSVQLDLSPKAQQALAGAAPLVNTLCEPDVVATADDLQQFTAAVLPALTVIAVEYAAIHHE